MWRLRTPANEYLHGNIAFDTDESEPSKTVVAIDSITSNYKLEPRTTCSKLYSKHAVNTSEVPVQLVLEVAMLYLLQVHRTLVLVVVEDVLLALQVFRSRHPNDRGNSSVELLLEYLVSKFIKERFMACLPTFLRIRLLVDSFYPSPF